MTNEYAHIFTRQDHGVVDNLRRAYAPWGATIQNPSSGKVIRVLDDGEPTASSIIELEDVLQAERSVAFNLWADNSVQVYVRLAKWDAGGIREEYGLDGLNRLLMLGFCAALISRFQTLVANRMAIGMVVDVRRQAEPVRWECSTSGHIQLWAEPGPDLLVLDSESQLVGGVDAEREEHLPGGYRMWLPNQDGPVAKIAAALY